jgi:diguanylate cyclase (GGDEF)-like protein/PAS domain S-box-containing protein
MVAMNLLISKRSPSQRALIIAMIYAALAALWILLSDSVLAVLISDTTKITQAQTFKGWFFVSTTAVMLFFLARWQLSAVEAAHLEARETAERLRSILASINDLVFIFDPQHHYIECYQPEAKTLMVTPDQFLYKRVDDVGLPPETAQRFIEAIDALKSSTQIITVDYPLDVPLGRRWFSAHFSRLLDSEGVFSGVTCVVRDITHMKDIETAAISAQALSDTLIDSLPGVFFLIDFDTHLLRWNENVETLTGYSAQELQGISVISLIPPDARKLAVEQMMVFVSSGRVQAEFPLLSRDGREIPHFFHARHVIINGQPCAVGIGTDISDRLHAKEKLRASEQRFRTLLEDIPNISVQGYNEKRQVIFWNTASEKLYGYSRAEAIGRPLEALIIPEPMRDVVVDLHTQWINEGAPIPAGELELLHKNGSAVPVYSSHTLIRNSLDEAEMYCIDVDLGDLRKAQNELRLAATVFDGSGEAILITDTQNRILSANQAFSNITGYLKDEIIGRDPAFLSSGRHDEAFYHAMWQTLQDCDHWQGEVWNRRKNGDVFPEWLGISAVRNTGGQITHYVAIFSDISEKKATEAKLEFLAHHDSLTNLPNRILVKDRIVQALALAMREKMRVALMFLDLDHFKVVNDTLGHVVGDKLLQAVVERLKDCVRETDTISRQGGDEFLVALTGLHNSEAVTSVSEKILQRMDQVFDIEGHTLTCSFSIGIAIYPEDGSDFDTLLLKADTAMYHAKDAGRNTYRFFTEKMNANAHERFRMQNCLRQAIEQGELQLHYQPQVDLTTGRITGAEALLRWNSAELGSVSPARFIPVAEDSGLIIRIGEWVLREACKQAEAWRQAGLPPLSIAVNMSPLQFKRSDPVALVSQILAETRLPANCLELEITESLLVHDIEEVLEVLHRLTALGVRIAIDDFGTGYSSLSYLKRFPIDKLKIDQSFVRDIATDADDAAIVHVIIELGRILNLKIIAEGVEDRQQLDFLTQAGCGHIQGYLFGRPVPAAEFARQIGEKVDTI